MGFLDLIFNRKSESSLLFDFELFSDTTNRLHMKKLAVDTCASFLARTISQSDFRVKENDKFIKDELYYRLNVRPNINQTASTFWQEIMYKLVYENEVLVIKTDTDDLLIADDFDHKEYAVFEDTFSNVTVKNYTFTRTFRQGEVFHLKYANESLSPLIDSLFKDYGDLFGRMINSQKRKNQIRSTVKVDSVTAKNKEGLEKLQEFINRMYKAVEEKDIAIIPEQPGFEYKEHFTGSGNGIQSVDEINKVTGGFFDQVATALGIPLTLIRGDMADVEKVTKNYMMYTINPILKKIKDEGCAKFFDKREYLNGSSLDVRAPSYQSIFDLATSIDKLIASGTFNGDEIRAEVGYELSGDPKHSTYYITKNYSEMAADEGGEKEE